MSTPEQLNLADLSDKAFSDLVNQDVRQGLAEELSEMLRQPDVVERWYDTLCSLKRSVEAQLAANHADRAEKQAEYLSHGDGGVPLWKAYLAEALRWRSGAVRFKNGVEDRLAEARRIRQQNRAKSHVSTLLAERDDLMDDVLRLRRGILEHRAYVSNHEEEDTAEADESLWALVDSSSVT